VRFSSPAFWRLQAADEAAKRVQLYCWMKHFVFGLVSTVRSKFHHTLNHNHVKDVNALAGTQIAGQGLGPSSGRHFDRCKGPRTGHSTPARGRPSESDAGSCPHGRKASIGPQEDSD
jgi:hypothetical protein